MTTRFDLEQQILDCWRIVDDLDVLFEGICEGTMADDEAANLLLGLKELYSRKFNRTFNTFEACIKANEI